MPSVPAWVGALHREAVAADEYAVVIVGSKRDRCYTSGTHIFRSPARDELAIDLQDWIESAGWHSDVAWNHFVEVIWDAVRHDLHEPGVVYLDLTAVGMGKEPRHGTRGTDRTAGRSGA